MGKEIVGMVECPECGLSGAQIKRQKSGLLYRWCPDCGAQYFPRSAESSDRLAARLAPVPPVTNTGTERPERKAEKTQETPEQKRGFKLGAL